MLFLRRQSKVDAAHPLYKELELRIQRVKSMPVEVDPLPEVDWQAQQWQDDQLRLLQNYELGLQHDRARVSYRQLAARKRKAMRQAAQGMTRLHQVLDVDWGSTSVDKQELHDLVSQLDYLDECVEQLGRLSSAELSRLIRMKPSGFETANKDNDQGEKPEGGGMELQRYNGKKSRQGTAAEEERKAAQARRQAIKDLQLKQVALYRALATQQFVETTDQQLADREKRKQEALADLAQQLGGGRRVISKEQQDEFFNRLMLDVHTRREALVARQQHQLEQEASHMRPFRARPYNGPPSPRHGSGESSQGSWSNGSRSRSRSPSPGRGAMGWASPPMQEQTFASGSWTGGSASVTAARKAAEAAAAAAAQAGLMASSASSATLGRVAEREHGTPSPRQGGGFAYWYAGGAPGTPQRPTSAQPGTGRRPTGHSPAAPHTRPRSALPAGMAMAGRTATATGGVAGAYPHVTHEAGHVTAFGAGYGAGREQLHARAVPTNLRPAWGAPPSQMLVAQQQQAQRHKAHVRRERERQQRAAGAGQWVDSEGDMPGASSSFIATACHASPATQSRSDTRTDLRQHNQSSDYNYNHTAPVDQGTATQPYAAGAHSRERRGLLGSDTDSSPAGSPPTGSPAGRGDSSGARSRTQAAHQHPSHSPSPLSASTSGTATPTR